MYMGLARWVSICPEGAKAETDGFQHFALLSLLLPLRGASDATARNPGCRVASLACPGLGAFAPSGRALTAWHAAGGAGRASNACNQLLFFFFCLFLALPQVRLEALAAEVAGGAVAAAVAGNAVVAGEGAGADEVEDAEFVGEGPGLGLVEPHEGRVDHELLVHGEVERHVETFDKSVAAVGIAREISL